MNDCRFMFTCVRLQIARLAGKAAGCAGCRVYAPALVLKGVMV